MKVPNIILVYFVTLMSFVDSAPAVQMDHGGVQHTTSSSVVTNDNVEVITSKRHTPPTTVLDINYINIGAVKTSLGGAESDSPISSIGESVSLEAALPISESKTKPIRVLEDFEFRNWGNGSLAGLIWDGEGEFPRDIVVSGRSASFMPDNSSGDVGAMSDIKLDRITRCVVDIAIRDQ